MTKKIIAMLYVEEFDEIRNFIRIKKNLVSELNSIFHAAFFSGCTSFDALTCNILFMSAFLVVINDYNAKKSIAFI